MIRVIRAAEHERLPWQEVPRPPGDGTPPGYDVLAFGSQDQRFTAGLWRRPAREGEMIRPFDEVSIIIDGIAEVVDPDGTVHRAGPGDALVTPRGSGGTWRCVTEVKKFWAIAETETEAPGTQAVPSDRLPAGGPPEEAELVMFRSADGRFATGLWRAGPSRGPMPLSACHRVSYLLDGELEVTDERDGTLHRAGPGDVLVTPRGSHVGWHARTPVRTFWATYQGW